MMATYDVTDVSMTGLIDLLVQTLFNIIPEDGLSLAILDQHGNCWSSHPSELLWLSSDDALLSDLTDRIDDGNDPLVVAVNDTYVVASQLMTEKANYGYSLLVLPKRNADSVLQNWDLIELVLYQINLNAQLYENNPSALC
jgi:hypothetical protein